MDSPESVTMQQLIDQRTEAFRKRLEAAVERLRANPDFQLVFGENGLARLPLPSMGEMTSGAAPSNAKPSRTPTQSTAPKKRKSAFARKRGKRATSVEKVIMEAGRCLTGDEIEELLPTVGYKPKWSNPGANVRAIIQEYKRQGVTRLVLRDGRFGLAEWPESKWDEAKSASPGGGGGA